MSILGSIVTSLEFNVVTNDLDHRTTCTLSKSADGRKLGGVTGTPRCCAAIQKDLHGLENRADRNLLKFNRETQNPASGGEE